MMNNKLSIFALVHTVMSPEDNVREASLFFYTMNNDEFSSSFENLLSVCQSSDHIKSTSIKRGNIGNNKWAYLILDNSSFTRKKLEIVLR